VIGYRVADDCACEDLASIALRFKPTFAPNEDVLGLANQKLSVPDECDLSAKALNRIVSRKDADSILAANAVLREELVQSMATLLEIARYDVAAYRNWVADH
jgi:hypothetical protein